MREKYLWLVIGILTVMTLGQACYIYEQSAVAKEISAPPVQPAIHSKAHSLKAYKSQQEEFKKWQEKVRGRIKTGTPLLDPDFDVFFDDRFFAERANPFSEIDNIRNSMMQSLQGSEKASFDAYWDKWFARRMLMTQFRTEAERTDNDITLTIHLPGLDPGGAKINITGDRIKITFSSEASQVGSGLIARNGPRQSYVKILPVPPDAVPGSGRVEMKRERLKIRFARQQGSK